MTILGEEWSVGKGLVDWFYYATGKVSSEYGSATIAMSLISSLTRSIQCGKAFYPSSCLSSPHQEGEHRSAQ